MYSIYRITSPSGRSYIGYTKNSVRSRWHGHLKVARKNPNKRHPLYDSIRKFGGDSFALETLFLADDLEFAKKLEVACIAAARLSSNLYNISSGGEDTDGEGSRRFWVEIRKDPERLDQYLKNLSEGILRANRDRTAIMAGAAKWREENPREAYEIGQRNIRCAIRWCREHPREANKNTRRAARLSHRKLKEPDYNPDNRTLKDRLLFKWKRSEWSRRQTQAMWDRFTPEERASHAENVSIGKKESWEKVTNPQERSRLTQVARDSIDRSVQGPAASRGIKAWWEDLRKNPVAYATHIETRKATLKKTREAKKCASTIS